MTLPKPNVTAQALSAQLVQKIRNKIKCGAGWISFADFMQMSLYEPCLGYYVNGSHKIGRQGDFVTGSELTPLFSHCIAKKIHEMVDVRSSDILEFGAGTGRLAADCLLYLERMNCTPLRYFIIEVSPDLVAQQQQTLQRDCPHLLSKVEWLTQLPNNFNGAIIANEVLDAMPVHLFKQDHARVLERGFTWANDQLVWQTHPANARLSHEVNALQLSRDYCSEISMAQSAWLGQLAACLTQGVIILIDYGYNRQEYYHPERSMGTLMCHYRHHAHDDPLFYPGLQDITAHVDFTALGLMAERCGLEGLYFDTQANFLLSCGITEMVESGDTVAMYQQAQALKTLLLPSGMGEVFKVALFGK